MKRVKFEVLEQASVSLLSAKASKSLKLIKFNEECVVHTSVQNEKKVELKETDVLEKYDDVFSGLGILPDEYPINMNKSVSPIQNSPRRVPIPVKEELKEKISELEKSGILAKVVTPSNMVVVKKNK